MDEADTPDPHNTWRSSRIAWWLPLENVSCQSTSGDHTESHLDYQLYNVTF